MSLSIALQNALSGLQTNESALQVISNNVTNATTEGYTRKSAPPISRVIAGTGQGVETSNLSRVVDERLLSNLRTTLSEKGSAQIQDYYYKQIVEQFGTLSSNTSLGSTLNGLATALQNMAATPENSAYRATVINEAVAVARKLNELSAKIQEQRFNADKDISTKVGVINGELQKIADLNSQIETAQARGDSIVELEDLRDQAINNVSGLVDVRYFARSSGAVVVTLSDGRVLADTRANLLSHTSAAALSPDIAYPSSGVGPIVLNGTDVTSSIKAGELKGLIDARDTTLPAVQSEIDRLSQVLRNQINAVHNAGSGNPPANTLTGTRTFAAPATDTITTTAGVRIAVVDSAGKFVAHYDLAAGTYTVQQIETLIDTNLAGFASAATSADGPLSISANAAGNGIAVVDLGTQNVLHTDGATTYSGFSNYFGLNDFFVTPGKVQGGSTTGLSALIKVRDDIASNPTKLSRGTLTATLVPAPVAGDTAIAAGDNTIAQALADKFLEPISFTAAGNLSLTTTTLAGYAGEILSANSVSASLAEKSLGLKSALAQELSFRTQSISGVNVDEELKNMVIYQNAYRATARIVQVVADLFDVLTTLGR